jgi:hypothetical protein
MNDLNSLFSLLAEEKKKKKQIENKLRESCKQDVAEMFEQLTGKVEESPVVIVEESKIPAEPVVVTPEVRVKNVTNDVNKYLTDKSFQQPNPDKVAPELKAVTDKIKFLEQAIGRIAATGPGGGEVNLRYLDDVDRSTIANGLYLRYNSTKKKFEFSAIEDIDNPAQIQSDWDQTDNTKADYIKNKPVDYLTAEDDTLDSVTDRGNTTTNDIFVNSLNVPVGSVISGASEIIANITNAALNVVLEHGNSAALDIGDYGLTNGITGVPYTVYELKAVPSPALQVDDIIGGAAIPVLSKILFVGSGIYNKIIITDKNFAVGATLPPENTVITFARPIVNAGLSISTDLNTDITLNPGAGGHIVPHADIIPYTTNIWSLGTPGKRFKEIWLGAGTIYVQDETLGNDQALGAKDGDFYIAGGAGLTVGEFRLHDNTLQIKDSTRDVFIGQLGATADVVFNRAIKVRTSAGRESFAVARSGLTTITTPDTLLTTQSALNIVGSSSGAQYPRNFTGTLLQMTAQDGQSARLSMDTFGGTTNTYALLAGRAARGTVDAPTATQSGDTLFRISVQGYGTTGFVSSIGRIALAAKQTFTDSAAGTEVVFQTTPNGSTTIGTSAKIDDTGLVLTGTTNVNSGITFRDGSRLKYFPSTTGKAGYHLGTDGTDIFWEPDTIIEGSVVFKGEWNASTNTPTVSNATGSTGWQYIVSVAGTQNLGNGSVAYTVGDQIIHDGTKYIRIPAQSAHIQSNWTETNTSAPGFILNKPTLFSGNYNDLTNKPTIPAPQIQSDWNQSNNLSLDFIKNKPTIPTQGITSILPTTLNSTNHVAATTVGTVATLICDATTANTPNTIVLRDSNGNINVSSWSVNTHLTAVNYAVSATDYWIGFTAKNKTLTLPATANTGRQYYIADTVHSGNPQITITAAAGATVSGNTSLTQQGQSVIATFINGVWYCN